MTVRELELAYLTHGDDAALDELECSVNDPLERAWIGLLRYDRTGRDALLELPLAGGRPGLAADAARSLVRAGVLRRRALRDGDPTDLDEAVRAGRAALDQPGGRWFATRHQALVELALTLHERYSLRGDPADLRAAVAAARSARPRARTQRAARLRLIAACEHDLYLSTGLVHRLRRADRGYRLALDLFGPRAVGRPRALAEYSIVRLDVFERTDDAADIAVSVRCAREAVALCPRSAPEYPFHALTLSSAYHARYEYRGRPRDRRRVVARCREALAALAAGSPYRPQFLDRLAVGLLDDWEADPHRTAVLDEAVAVTRAAVDTRGVDDGVLIAHLALALWSRWELRGDPEDLAESVLRSREAVRAMPADAPRREAIVGNLAELLISRYTEEGEPADLDESLALVGKIASSSRPARGRFDGIAGRGLLARYERAGDRNDLDRAVAALRQAIAAIPAGSEVHQATVGRLARALLRRFEADGRRRDLDHAIRYGHAALAATEPRADVRASRLNLLAVLYALCFQHFGDPNDAATSLHLQRSADAAGQGAGTEYLRANLGSARHQEFEQTARLRMLDDAVELHRHALSESHPHRPDRPVLLNNLGVALQARFEYRGNPADLAQALAVHEEAVAACPYDSPDRAGLVQTLAAALLQRLEIREDLTTLDRIVSLCADTVARLSSRNVDRPRLVAAWAEAAAARAAVQGDLAGVDEALHRYREALRLLRPGAPDRPAMLLAVANILAARPGSAGRSVGAAFRRAVSAAGTNSLQRLDASRALGEWAAEHGDHRTAAIAFAQALAARAQVLRAQFSGSDRTPWLSGHADLAALAADSARRAGRSIEAVLALEVGRATETATAIGIRDGLVRLGTVGQCGLAERYRGVSARLSDVDQLYRRQVT